MFRVRGKVKKSLGRGRELGFPTANIEVGDDVPEGIFLAWTVLTDGSRHKSLFFVGGAVTFGESSKQGEAYLLDFEGDLYGKQIRVETLRKLRDNRAFDSPEALVERMKDDERRARKFFDNLAK